MPSTHLSLHYHIIFSTKGRSRIIAEPWREELHAYIGGIIRDIGAIPRSIGGPNENVRRGIRGVVAVERGGVR
jgi:hypothetical protein